MARAPTRIKRTLLLLVALAVLLLLLELNRWLPGTWPGGGGGGFRAAGELGLDDPDRGDERGAPPGRLAQDPGTVEPPDEAPADWPPRLGILIEVRGPDGGLAGGWRAGTGDGGAEDSAPGTTGRTLRRDRRLTSEGFRIRHRGRLVRFRHGTDVPASHWIVHLPGAAPPQERQPGITTVRVRDRASGAPLPGATATWQADGASRAARADAQGDLSVPAPRDGAPLALRVRTERHGEVRTWVVPRDPEPRAVTLSTTHRVRARFTWPDRTPAAFLRVEARTPAGRVLARQATGSMRTTGPEIALDVPSEDVATARLHLRPARAGFEGLRLDLPLAEVTGAQQLPAVRTVRLRALDVEARPLDRAEVVVFFDAGESAGAEPAPWRTVTNLAGEAQISVPVGRDLRVLVTKGALGPAGRVIRTVDGSDVLDVVLEQGIDVPIRVLDADGRPVPGATLAARGLSQGVRVERAGTLPTDAEGRGVVGPLARGAVEVYASAPGYAWVAAVVQAAPAMGTTTVTLERARSLRLVAAGPFGVPLEGVTVDVTVAAGGAPLAAPPGHAPQRTDARGLVVLDDLPARRYDLTLTRPGWTTRIVRGLQPGAATHFVTLLRQP